MNDMRIEEKRIRCAKRKAKLPCFIACYGFIDLVHPDAGVLRDAYEVSKDRTLWMQLPCRFIDSEPLQCWENVEKAIAYWGGRMVSGWSFRIDPLEGFVNCMADIEARPHAVWCDNEGRLWEVSHDFRGCSFVPSDKVQPYMAINVGFTDTEFQARTYCPPEPHPLISNFYIRIGKEKR